MKQVQLEEEKIKLASTIIQRAVRNGLNFTERGFGARGAVGISDRGHTAASQLKPGDFDWAERNASRVAPGCLLYLQPEWSARERVLPFIVEYIEVFPKWKISLQSHKYIGIP